MQTNNSINFGQRCLKAQKGRMVDAKIVMVDWTAHCNR